MKLEHLAPFPQLKRRQFPVRAIINASRVLVPRSIFHALTSFDHFCGRLEEVGPQ